MPRLRPAWPHRVRTFPARRARSSNREYAVFTAHWLKLEHYRLDLTMTKQSPLATRAAALPRMRALLLACCVLWLGACDTGKGGEQGRAGGQPAVVTTTRLASGPWNDSIEALGTASARESLAITAKVSETVGKVHFESGDAVKAGQVLVTLSDRAQSAELNEAAAQFRVAESLFERQRSLAERQLVAVSQLDAQRAVRDAAKARLEQMRAQVGDRVISAPFDGVLGLRMVSEGSLVTPGTVITTLDDVSTIRLDFSVPERQIAALAVGQPVVATSDAFPGEEFEGTIASVGSRVDAATRALSARADIANPARKLRAGMLMRVRLQQPARTVLQVPELSLQQVGQQAFVFRVDGEGKVEQVPVKIGSRRPGWVEILEGVNSGDRIVVEGIVKLKPGASVVEAEPAKSAPKAPAASGA
jgi:membrane fusion protein (multidrug efflux system)